MQRNHIFLCIILWPNTKSDYHPSALGDGSDRSTCAACADKPSLARLRASSSGDYVVPRTKLKFGERAFAVAAPQI